MLGLNSNDSDGKGSEEDSNEKDEKEDDDEEEVGLGSDYTEIELFFEGLRSYDGERFTLAKSMFAKLISKFPASPLVVVAELKLADSLFYGQKFPEAIGAYRDFISVHSTHEAKPYALYQIARSYQLAYQGSKQDETPIKEATKAYLDLINQFPDSYFTHKAKNSILECDRALLNSEKEVIDFYIKTDKPEAAKARLIYAKANYGHLPEVDSILNYKELEDQPKTEALEANTPAPKIKLADKSATELATEKILPETDATTELAARDPQVNNSNKVQGDQNLDQEVSNELAEDISPTKEKNKSLNAAQPVDKGKPILDQSISENSMVVSNQESFSPSVIEPNPEAPPLSKEEKFLHEISKAENLAKSTALPTTEIPVPSLESKTQKSDQAEIDVPLQAKVSNTDGEIESKELKSQIEKSDKFEKMKLLASSIPASTPSPRSLGKMEENQNGSINPIRPNDQIRSKQTLGSLEPEEPKLNKALPISDATSGDDSQTSATPTTTPTDVPKPSLNETLGQQHTGSIFLKTVACNSNEDSTLISLELKTPPIIRSSKNYKLNGVFGENTFQIKLVLQNQLSIVPQASNQAFTNNEDNWIITKSSNCQNTFDKIQIFEKTRRVIDPSGFEPSATIHVVIDSVKEKKLGISYSQNREKINISVK